MPPHTKAQKALCVKGLGAACITEVEKALVALHPLSGAGADRLVGYNL